MIDEMWMMRPHWRSFICGTSARVSAMQRAQVQLDDPVPVFVGDLVDRLRQCCCRRC